MAAYRENHQWRQSLMKSVASAWRGVSCKRQYNGINQRINGVMAKMAWRQSAMANNRRQAANGENEKISVAALGMAALASAPQNNGGNQCRNAIIA
jgi:hypothetical protein